MKIVTIARTLNEEEVIGKFCERYGFSDKIIISDGGSTDKTVEIARSYPNVVVHEDFPHKIVMHEALPHMYYTNEPAQINFLIECAKAEQPDWIIYDDADCFPNKTLSADARTLLENCRGDVIEVFRYYIYGDDRYFPKLNEPGQSFWAWRNRKVVVLCDESKDPREQNLSYIPYAPHDFSVERFNPPHVLLHYYARSEEDIKKSLYWYAMKDQPKRHPLFGGGPLEKLPDYAI